MNKKTNKTWSRGRLVPFLSELLRQRILPPFKQARKGYINDMMDSVTIVVVIIALRNKTKNRNKCRNCWKKNPMNDYFVNSWVSCAFSFHLVNDLSWKWNNKGTTNKDLRNLCGPPFIKLRWTADHFPTDQIARKTF